MKRNVNMEDYEIELLAKLDLGVKLTESEIRELVFECGEVDTKYGDNRRWTRRVTSITEIGARYFCTVWEEGLTESQENEFYHQPYEVTEHKYEKTITVTEWKPLGENA